MQKRLPGYFPVLILVQVGIVTAVLLQGCSKKPAEIAEQFAKNIHNGKQTEAKKLATEPSARLMEKGADLGISTKVDPDFKFEIIQQQVDGNKAIIRYKDTTDVSSLMLVNVEGTWKVDLEATSLQRQAAIAAQQQARAQQQKEAKQDLSTCYELALACRLYATEHKGAFPAKLKDLYPDYLASEKSFISPLATDSSQPSYDYFGGYETDPPDKVLLKGRYKTADGRYSVVYADLTAKQLP